jgi:hypothetical protein
MTENQTDNSKEKEYTIKKKTITRIIIYSTVISIIIGMLFVPFWSEAECQEICSDGWDEETGEWYGGCYCEEWYVKRYNIYGWYMYSEFVGYERDLNWEK